MLEDLDARKFAVEILGQMGDPRSVVSLCCAGCPTTTPTYESPPLKPLGAVGGPEGHEGLLVALERDDIATRVAALSALVNLGAPLKAQRLTRAP